MMNLLTILVVNCGHYLESFISPYWIILWCKSVTSVYYLLTNIFFLQQVNYCISMQICSYEICFCSICIRIFHGVHHVSVCSICIWLCMLLHVCVCESVCLCECVCVCVLGCGSHGKLV